MKKHQEFEINCFQDEAGYFTAQVPAIRGCVAWGKTLEEAYRNASERFRCESRGAGDLLRVARRSLAVFWLRAQKWQGRARGGPRPVMDAVLFVVGMVLMLFFLLVVGEGVSISVRP